MNIEQPSNNDLTNDAASNSADRCVDYITRLARLQLDDALIYVCTGNPFGWKAFGLRATALVVVDVKHTCDSETHAKCEDNEKHHSLIADILQHCCASCKHRRKKRRSVARCLRPIGMFRFIDYNGYRDGMQVYDEVASQCSNRYDIDRFPRGLSSHSETRHCLLFTRYIFQCFCQCALGGTIEETSPPFTSLCNHGDFCSTTCFLRRLH